MKNNAMGYVLFARYHLNLHDNEIQQFVKSSLGCDISEEEMVNELEKAAIIFGKLL